jgi:hypothetical protein
MILTFLLHGDKLSHMVPAQYGAFVQHCFGMKNFYAIKLFKTGIEISFNLGDRSQLVDSAKIQAQLQEDVDALASLDPHPCPCGCGAYIAISPCFRQSGTIDDGSLIHGCTKEEIATYRSGKRLEAIKAVRLRTQLGLKDAKDLIEAADRKAP